MRFTIDTCTILLFSAAPNVAFWLHIIRVKQLNRSLIKLNLYLLCSAERFLFDCLSCSLLYSITAPLSRQRCWVSGARDVNLRGNDRRRFPVTLQGNVTRTADDAFPAKPSRPLYLPTVQIQRPTVWNSSHLAASYDMIVTSYDAVFCSSRLGLSTAYPFKCIRSTQARRLKWQMRRYSLHSHDP